MRIFPFSKISVVKIESLVSDVCTDVCVRVPLVAAATQPKYLRWPGDGERREDEEGFLLPSPDDFVPR